MERYPPALVGVSARWRRPANLAALALATLLAVLGPIRPVAACEALAHPDSNVPNHRASTSLRVEAGKGIDAVPESRVGQVTIARNSPNEVEASVVVRVPSGYSMDPSTVMSVVDGNLIKAYYRLALLPSDAPVLGCDSQVRLVYGFAGLWATVPGKSWRVEIHRLGAISPASD